MLDILDCIRIDSYTSPSRKNRKPIDLYIFICLKCPNEIKSYKSAFKSHSGLCVKCASKSSQPKAIAKIKLRPYEQLYNRLLDRAKKFGSKTITYEEFLQFVAQEECHYCHVEISWKKKQTYNLDRADNHLGYTMDNLVVCCGSCNKTKGDRFTYDEFMLLAQVLRRIALQRRFKGY